MSCCGQMLQPENKIVRYWKFDKSPHQETTNKVVTTHTPCDFVFLTQRHQKNVVDGEFLNTNSHQIFCNRYEHHLQCL
jgi:hypothetical protein